MVLIVEGKVQKWDIITNIGKASSLGLRIPLTPLTDYDLEAGDVFKAKITGINIPGEEVKNESPLKNLVGREVNLFYFTGAYDYLFFSVDFAKKLSGLDLWKMEVSLEISEAFIQDERVQIYPLTIFQTGTVEGE
jgi:hypothetical protein